MDTQEKIQSYWNTLGARERVELFKKVTGAKVEINQVVNFAYPPVAIESFLESHPDEIKPKYQVFVKMNSESEWEKCGNETYLIQVADNIADEQLHRLSAWAVAIKNLLEEKLVYINY